MTRSEMARLKEARIEIQRIDDRIEYLRDWVKGAERILNDLGPKTFNEYCDKNKELNFLLSTLPTAEDVAAAEALYSLRA